MAVAIGGLAALKALVPAAWTTTLNDGAMLVVYAHASAVLLQGFRSIEDLGLRRLTKYLLILEAALALPSIGQMLLLYLPGVPPALRAAPYVQLAFFFSMVGLIIAYVMRSPEQSAASGGTDLPVQFVLRYGITPRECDIIAMMERGHSNRQLADRLFISARTVKNHLYHIYQKTGVANKVQLINLMRTFPSNGRGRAHGGTDEGSPRGGEMLK